MSLGQPEPSKVGTLDTETPRLKWGFGWGRDSGGSTTTCRQAPGCKEVDTLVQIRKPRNLQEHIALILSERRVGVKHDDRAVSCDLTLVTAVEPFSERCRFGSMRCPPVDVDWESRSRSDLLLLPPQDALQAFVD